MILSALVFAGFLAALAAGVPIAVAIGLPTLLAYLYLGLPIASFITVVFGGINSFALMAIPFFILAGKIMDRAGITERIVAFANALVGHLRGGLGQVTVVASMIMAGIQGSGVAEASAIGSVVIPAMVKQGYSRSFAATLTASAATMGPIIPPSIVFILYAFYTNQSVGALFLGGAIPGLLIGCGLLVVCYWMSVQRGYRFRAERMPVMEMVRVLNRSLVALAMPFVIVGGIVTGFFTATESGIIAVLYSLIYGTLISGQLKLRDLPAIVIDATAVTATVMFVVAMSNVFGRLLARLGFNAALIEVVAGIGDPTLTMLVIFVVLLVLGCFIDVVVILAMFSVSLANIGQQLGFDPVHFGVLICVVILLGAITPPVGTILYVALGIAQVDINECLGDLMKFFAVELAVVALIIVYPPIVTWLPSIFM